MKSKKWMIYLGILLIIITSTIGAYFFLDPSEKQTAKASGPSTQSSPQINPSTQSSPQIDDQGDVQVVAIWERFDNSSQQRFLIQLNNHQFDLSDFELKNNVLFKKNDREINFLVISESKKPNGHHLASQIIVESQDFENLKQGDELTLVVKNVLDTPDRVFAWSY